ncbi:MAG: hypothetical protein HY929_04370 [Euryarchaeota archaeon]|nr:hypothetical protein [Euryarchaeota archaeon]
MEEKPERAGKDIFDALRESSAKLFEVTIAVQKEYVENLKRLVDYNISLQKSMFEALVTGPSRVFFAPFADMTKLSIQSLDTCLRLSVSGIDATKEAFKLANVFTGEWHKAPTDMYKNWVSLWSNTFDTFFKK